MIIKFTIIGEACSIKNSRQLVPTRSGVMRSIKSTDALAYEKSAFRQIPPDCRLMIEGPVRITFRMFYSTERKDMCEALTQDCLQARYTKIKGGLIKIAPGEYKRDNPKRVLIQRGPIINDRQIKERHVYWNLDKINPRVEVEIETLEAT